MRFLTIAMLLAFVGNVSKSADTVPTEGLRESPPQVFALVGGRVVCEPGKVLDNATIIVDGTIITAITSGDEIPASIPVGARRIDATGKTIYAGFIDSYNKVEITANNDQPGYWNSQITPQSRVVDSLSADAKVNEALRNQGIAVRLASPRDGIIKGQSTLVTTAPVDKSAVVLVPTVAQHVELTIGWGRRDEGYPNSPMGAVALARQAMLDAEWYESAHAVAAADPSVPRPEQNVALQSLATCLNAQRMVIAVARDEQFALRADRFAREFGLRLVLLGSGREYHRLDEIAATGRPVIVPVDFPKPPRLDSPQAASEASLADLMHWKLAPENPGRLATAGVSIMLTTDGLKDPADFLSNVRKAVKRGLPADEALAALTTRPANLFDVDDRLGTVAVGKAATLVVAEGDLFSDSKARVVATWIDGQQYETRASPVADFGGVWKLKFDKPVATSNLWYLEVKTGSAKPSAEFSREIPPAKVDQEKGKKPLKEAAESESSDSKMDLEGLVVSGFQLSGLVVAPKAHNLGKLPLSATILPADDGMTLIGSIRLGDGSTIEFTGAMETPKSATKAEDDENAAGDESEDVDNEGDNDDARENNVDVIVNYPFGPFGVAEFPEPEIVAFTNATVWTGSENGIIENATLLVTHGKIEAVGNDVEIPKEARLIDCRGKHVSAGIIDCHSHIATDGGINESGQAITAEVRISDFVDARDINIYRQLAGGVTAINVLHGSANPIGGQNQVVKMRWGLTGEQLKMAEAPAGIKFALGENVKQSNWGERHTTRYPQTRMGVDEIMIDQFAAARRYSSEWQQWRTEHKGLPPRRDLQLEAVAQILEHKRWIHCHSYKQTEIIALLRTLDRYDVRIGTLQHILEGYKVTPEMAKHGAMASSFADWWAYKFEVYDAIPFNGAMMHDAGIVVSFNSDDPELGRHLNHEAAKAMKYGGVPADEAWKFVTLNPAKQLRIDQYTGSLEPGKQADVVVWSGPPMSTLSKCEQTWVDGCCYFDMARDQDFRQRDAKLKAQLIAAVLASGESSAKPGDNRIDESRFWPRHDEYCAGHDHDDHLHFHE